MIYSVKCFFQINEANITLILFINFLSYIFSYFSDSICAVVIFSGTQSSVFGYKRWRSLQKQFFKKFAHCGQETDRSLILRLIFEEWGYFSNFHCFRKHSSSIHLNKFVKYFSKVGEQHLRISLVISSWPCALFWFQILQNLRFVLIREC